MFPLGSSPVVALDANVLYGYPLRDTLLTAAEAEFYRPAWSEDVWAEVTRNLQDPSRKRPYTHEEMNNLMDTIRSVFPDAFIDGYQALIPAMPVNPKDRHVAAMAVRAGAQVLVTYNRKHFPSAALKPYDIEVQHPDEFLHSLYLRMPVAMVGVVRAQAAALKNPPKTPRQVVDELERSRLIRFASAIRPHLDP